MLNKKIILFYIENANVVIGTYTVQSDSHTAMGVMDSSGNRIFNVDTIHDEVNITVQTIGADCSLANLDKIQKNIF